MTMDSYRFLDFISRQVGYILRPRELEEVTAPAIASRMKEEGVDAAVLVPS